MAADQGSVRRWFRQMRARDHGHDARRLDAVQDLVRLAPYLWPSADCTTFDGYFEARQADRVRILPSVNPLSDPPIYLCHERLSLGNRIEALRHTQALQARERQVRKWLRSGALSGMLD